MILIPIVTAKHSTQSTVSGYQGISKMETFDAQVIIHVEIPPKQQEKKYTK